MLGTTDQENTTTSSTSHDDDEVVVFKAATTTTTKRSKKKNSSSSSRRFSDEQIKSLEWVFKMENSSKLEARKKVEMATQLGLHPRQVAIWFQNRRARWKSKQVEQDYTNLKVDYDTLSHRFESLQKEKHDLLQQLNNVSSQLKEAGPCEKGDDELNNGKYNYSSSTRAKARGGLILELEQRKQGEEIYSYSDPVDQDDDDDPGQHKQELENPAVNMMLAAGDELAHESNNNNFFDLGSLFDQSTCGTASSSSNWWDVDV